MDIDLANLLFAEIVACLKNLWRVKPRLGRVPFEGPLVLGSLIYRMLKQQGIPMVQGEKEVEEVLEEEGSSRIEGSYQE